MRQGSIRFDFARPVLVVAPLLFALPAIGSNPGKVAAAWVRAESFQQILENELYTHPGDDRAYGPEHDLARANIQNRLLSYGLSVALEPFLYNGNTYYDVVGTKPGVLDPSREYIVGAHFDSVGTPGADDNASGVTLVLEAARILSQYDSDYTIRFIAFDREEQGLHGSQAYVAAHAGDNILGMISADMVAYNAGNDLAELYGRSASEPIKRALADAVLLYSDGLSVVPYGPLDASDHAPFEWAGVEACLLIEEWGNPNYHTPNDNCELSGYLDYDYAAGMTRAVVGFLVDHAGVQVDMPNADFDGDGDVDLDDFAALGQCFTGSGVPASPACDLFDFDADGDVDCDDVRMFRAVWTGQGDPPHFALCELMPPDMTGIGDRCLEITPPDPGIALALRLEGDTNDPRIACWSAYVSPDGRLVDVPAYRTASEWGAVIVCDADLLPDTLYHVSCEVVGPNSTITSPVQDVRTARWGDTVGLFVDGVWTEPDGSVDIIDVIAILQAFQGSPTAPSITYVDQVGVSPDGVECMPDGRIDILDAVMALTAFVGVSYADSTGCAAPCP